jgi:hypothetical protein
LEKNGTIFSVLRPFDLAQDKRAYRVLRQRNFWVQVAQVNTPDYDIQGQADFFIVAGDYS